MVGMAFDVASSMKCLARMIKETMSQHAMYFHCFAHCTELAFKDATFHSPLLDNSQDLCKDQYALVGAILKRVLLFQKIQEEIERDCSTTRLKNLSRTRWTTRGPAAEVIVRIHNELHEVLSQLKEDSSFTLNCKAKARGLLRKIQSFPVIFNLLAMQKLVQLLENNSRLCQRSTLTTGQALISIKKLYIRLQELRSEEEFQLLFETAVCLVDVEAYNEATAAKRKQAASSGLLDFIKYLPAPTMTTDMDESDVPRANFYGAIDVISQAIKNRFDQDDFRKLISISNCLIGAANKELCKDVKDKLACNSEPIKLDVLIEELQELPTYIKLHNKESGIPIKRVTKIDTICELMCYKDCYKE